MRRALHGSGLDRRGRRRRAGAAAARCGRRTEHRAGPPRGGRAGQPRGGTEIDAGRAARGFSRPAAHRPDRAARHAGTYAVIEDAALDWAPQKLLGGVAAIRTLSARTCRCCGARCRGRKIRAVVGKIVLAAGAGGHRRAAHRPAEARRAGRGCHGDDGAATARRTWTSLETGRAEVTLTRRRFARTATISPAASTAAAITAELTRAGAGARLDRRRSRSLPGLGALSLNASLDGPVARRGDAAGADGRAAARGRGTGGSTSPARPADLDVSGDRPGDGAAARPRRGSRCRSTAHVQRRVRARRTRQGTLRIAGLTAAGARVAHARRPSFPATPGTRSPRATAEGMRRARPAAGPARGTPLTLRADADLTGRTARTLRARPRAADARGHGGRRRAPRMQAHLDLPDLAPFAAPTARHRSPGTRRST